MYRCPVHHFTRLHSLHEKADDFAFSLQNQFRDLCAREKSLGISSADVATMFGDLHLLLDHHLALLKEFESKMTIADFIS